MPRMKILNRTEQASFDTPPVFNSEERKKFFDFPVAVLDMCKNLRKPDYKIGFLIACGYFKASRQFFRPEDFHLRDMQFVAQKIGDSSENINVLDYPPRTRQRHEQEILHYYGYRRFDKEAESYIKQEVSDMVRVQLKPKLIFWRCVDRLVKQQISLPSCYQLSEIILMALNQQKKELARIIDQELSQNTRSILDGLLAQNNDSSTGKNAQYLRYKLTLLKTISQSTKRSKVKERADDLLYLQELYGNLETILSVLKLGKEGIRYYANGVIKSDIFHLSRRSQEDRYVHLIAFIAHQYYCLQDNLADVLLTVMQSYQNSTTREHRDWCYENNKQRNQSFKSLFDSDMFTTFSSIRNVLNDEVITDAQKIAQIKKLLPQKAVDKSEELKINLQKTLNDKPYFEILENRSIRLQNRISPIVKVLDIQGEAGTAPLMEAIAYFKEKDGNITKHAPVEFLNSAQKDAINEGGTFHTSLYKVFLFNHIASGLKSGTLNLKHSFKYRTLDDYLISKERWNREKDELIERADLKEFVDPAPILDALDNALYEQYKITNKMEWILQSL